jgi:hypothetical protein
MIVYIYFDIFYFSSTSLDNECGVPDFDGNPCKNSLTCTIHTFESKRNIIGRSKTYDYLMKEKYNIFELVDKQMEIETKTNVIQNIYILYTSFYIFLYTDLLIN